MGVSDDKSVSGCTKWNEQRIHTVVHDSLFPSPSLDVKKFVIEGKKVYVIKIEEGSMPPYVTSKGGIYHRIGSGSTPIQDSGKLTELYNKRQDYISRVRNKIEIPPLEKDADLPNNIFGCSLMADLKRLELSTSRMRTERSPKRAGFSSLQTDKMFERC